MPPEDRIALPDGRTLMVRVSGPVDGLPLVFHHGTPSAGTELRALERPAHARGLRVVSASRPGYGASDRRPGRRVVDVVQDTQALLDALGAERCLVAGWSGGGPHALACGALLPAAAAVLVIAGVAPYGAEGLDWMAGMGEENIAEFSATLAGQEALRPYLAEQREQLKDATAAQVVTAMASILPEVDRAALTAEFGEDLAASLREGLRFGVDGWLDDDLAFVAPWGFELADVAAPVSVWHGSLDLMVPFAHGQWLASRTPRVTAHLEQGHGHLSVGLGAIEQALDELIAAGDGTPGRPIPH